MQMTRFVMTRDNNGYNAFGLPVSNTKFQGTLAAAVEQTITVPDTEDGTYRKVVAVFTKQDGTTIWVSINTTATLPGPAFAISDSQENPQVLFLEPGDVIHLITRSTTAECGVILYATI